MKLQKIKTAALTFALVIITLFLLSSFTIPGNGCDQYDGITVDDVMNLSPEGYEEWSEKTSFMDGTYYEAIIEFSDGTRGRLYRGASSGRHFVEDSNGANYYYNSLRSAIRALYLYKKYGCLTSKYRL